MASERKFTGVHLDTVAEDGEFSGHASLFGVKDLAGDVVERGAFAGSLNRRGVSGIRMLYQHDPNEVIGHWLDLREDHKGLYVRGRLANGVARAREVLALMRAGALDGLSIGFKTVKARKDASGGLRHIIEADLWEVSVVTFPMLPAARVAQVKQMPTVREFEHWLRRDAGLSRSAARGIIARGYAKTRREREAAHHPDLTLTDQIRAAAVRLQP